jgi:hypothetical protein
MSALEKSFRTRLVWIGIFHTIATVLVLVVLYTMNAGRIGSIALFDLERLLSNAALLSALGGLLYFSRKTYTYLITDKLGRVTGSGVEEKVQTQITGYTLYLCTRPVGAIVVGPLIVLAVLAGLTTLVARSGTASVAISEPGMYLIYFVSFIGGYSSSDLFDYFSALGSRLIKRINLNK